MVFQKKVQDPATPPSPPRTPQPSALQRRKAAMESVWVELGELATAFAVEAEMTELDSKAEYEENVNDTLKKLTALRVVGRRWQVATAAYLRQSSTSSVKIQERIRKFREQADKLEADIAK